MKSRLKIYVLIFCGSMLMLSCKSTAIDTITKPLAKHVILIGSDGFGAYAFKNGKFPNLRKMMDKGSYSLEARSVLPSSSAVNWASMIMGSPPELHGFTEWGSKTPEIPSRVIGKGGIYPSLFSLLETQVPNEKKGVIYTWGGIGYLFEKNMVDMDVNGASDQETMETALEFITNEKPVFTFVHFSEPDNTGHAIGHDIPEYYAAAENIDRLIGKIIAGLEAANMMEDTVILFSSDHGGVNKGHGGKTLVEMEIPWIIYGSNIQAKGKLNSTIITYDTAATIAHILGLETPEFWRGKNITEVFENEK